jgi:Fe-S-cluster containining protein
LWDGNLQKWRISWRTLR